MVAATYGGDVVRSIFSAAVITFLSACSMNNSSTENGENRFVYPYKCTYKGEVEYHSITSREPLSETFLAKLQPALYEGFELDPKSCVLVSE